MRNVKSIRVVCAIVLNKDAEVLIARRKEGKIRAGYWEFPGGKINSGESPEEAIIREIKEEMSIDIIPESILGAIIHHYPDLIVDLIGVACNIKMIPKSSADHDKIFWVNRNELKNQYLSDADLKLWDIIERKC